jgi:F-type H+-transporting ATPase subunit b
LKSLLKNYPARLFLVALLGINIFSALPARAQNTPAPATGSANSGVSQPDKMDAPDTDSQTESFRHAGPVQKIARLTNLSTETTAKIFEDLNSAILIGVILWFLLKFMPKMLRKRSEHLQKQIVEAQVASAQAAERLSAVEERLSKLGVEIDAIREQTERESASDEKRIQDALEEERKRIVASAEQEIGAASAAAHRDLKKFAAELAVDRAMGRIHLSAEDDHALIHNFTENLKKGERN